MTTNPTYDVRLHEDEMNAVLEALIERCMAITCPVKAGYLHDLAHKFLTFPVVNTNEEIAR
jgi:hypothetical protein